MSRVLIISDEPRRLEYKISRKLGIEIFKIENTLISVEELKNIIKDRIIILRVHSPYKLLILSLLCEKYAKKVINSSRLILTAFNRELLYSTLEENGIETPERYYIFDLCNVNDIVEKIGKTRALLLTFTKSDIEGIVETPQALISLVEHRYYMSAEDVKVNLVIPYIEDLENIVVIGKETEKRNNMVDRIVSIFGEGIYSITIARQRGREKVISIDPVPVIEDDEKIERVANYIEKISTTQSPL